jgi:glycosyltransferase involved in cell wall biosynthesis
MFSIILTIHNKDFLLNNVLNAIKINTVGTYEINAVLDGCSDKSEEILDSFISNNKNLKIKKFITPDIFETKANNVGLINSSGDYCIIVQDDMIINEYDWNNRLAKPIVNFSDVFAVSSQCSHNWIYNQNSQHQYMKEDLDNCWCDILIHTDHAERKKFSRDIFAIRDSANRGPLLLRHDILEKLKYLDESFSPQDMDDHDLCYRAFKQYGMLAGCYWTDIICDPSWGGTRVNGQTAKWQLKANHKNVKIVWERHKDLILSKKHNEDRQLS